MLHNIYIFYRSCHVSVFFFSFLYLFFFRSTIYFGIPYPPSHTNLVQMMLTLKIIGLAFEAHQSFKLKHINEGDNRTEERISEDDHYKFDLAFADIFHYIFNYCGVLTGNLCFKLLEIQTKQLFLGPYFKYTTYLDHLHKPYHKYVNLKGSIIKRLYLLPFLAAVHLITNYVWPLSVSKIITRLFSNIFFVV